MKKLVLMTMTVVVLMMATMMVMVLMMATWDAMKERECQTSWRLGT